jgi:hypothetical protein
VSSNHLTTDVTRFDAKHASLWCYDKSAVYGCNKQVAKLDELWLFADMLRFRSTNISRYLLGHENSESENLLDIIFDLTFIVVFTSLRATTEKIQPDICVLLRYYAA